MGEPGAILNGSRVVSGFSSSGSTWVAGHRRYGGQDLTIDLALGPDFTVLAVWFVYLENDGE